MWFSNRILAQHVRSPAPKGKKEEHIRPVGCSLLTHFKYFLLYAGFLGLFLNCLLLLQIFFQFFFYFMLLNLLPK